MNARFAAKILTSLLAAAALQIAGAIEDDRWNAWEGGSLPEPDWSVCDMYKWNLAAFFSENGAPSCVASKAELKACDGSKIAGVEMTWPYELEHGYVYRFVFPCVDLPDYVLANGRELVWEKSSGRNESGNIVFDFMPSGKSASSGEKFQLVFATPPDGVVRFPTQERWGQHKAGFQCLRRLAARTDKASFPARTLPAGLSFMRSDVAESLSFLPRYGRIPVDYSKAPLKLPAKQTSGPVFFENSTPVKGHLLNDGVNGLILTKGLKAPDSKRQFDLDLAMPMLKAERISNLCVMGPFYGKFILDKRSSEAQRMWLSAFAHAFLAQSPSNVFYILVPEVDGQNFGKWVKGHDIGNCPFISKEDAETLSLPDLYRKASASQRLLYDELRNSIDAGKRFKIVFMAHDALFELQCYYKAGADIVLGKNIGRQCLNIVVANARGSAISCGGAYGFDADCWFGWNMYNYAPEELADNLKVYFMAGGECFMTEAPTAVPVMENSLNSAPTALGAAWLDFVRWAKTHPQRGEQQAKIAIMRSFGKKGKGGTYGSMDDEHKKILDIVFPKHEQSKTLRLSTGTPYGPADIIPHDAPADVLKRYSVVLFIGSPGHDMTGEVLSNLKSFVEGGGFLALPADQLRMADGRFIKEDMSEFGVKRLTEGMDSMPLAKDGAPRIVESKLGAGRAMLFMSDKLSDDMDALREAASPELEKAKWLSLSQASDWIEYMVQRKGSSFILPVFNHGNVGFPSGNGRKTGTWKGKVSLDASKFRAKPDAKLAVYGVECSQDGQFARKLVRLNATEKNGRLEFDLDVNVFAEIVVGPEDDAGKDYFNSCEQQQRCAL